MDQNEKMEKSQKNVLTQSQTITKEPVSAKTTTTQQDSDKKFKERVDGIEKSISDVCETATSFMGGLAAVNASATGKAGKATVVAGLTVCNSNPLKIQIAEMLAKESMDTNVEDELDRHSINP